jgi:hypothetical protein
LKQKTQGDANKEKQVHGLLIMIERLNTTEMNNEEAILSNDGKHKKCG